MDDTDENDRRNLAELLSTMDKCIPIIPEEVSEYYLMKAGFECSDKRVVKIISLAVQKLIRDIANESVRCFMLRQQGAKLQNKNLTLTIEDLSSALEEYGIAIKKPSYFADSVNDQ